MQYGEIYCKTPLLMFYNYDVIAALGKVLHAQPLGCLLITKFYIAQPPRSRHIKNCICCIWMFYHVVIPNHTRKMRFNGASNFNGASVAKWLAHLPFTSEAAGSSLSENFLIATRTQSSCEKSKSQRSAESRGFPPGTPVSSHRES